MILDLQSLRALTDSDPDIERELAQLFCSTAERCLGRIAVLCSHDPAGDWASCLHELRGAALNLYANDLAGLCARYEQVKGDDRLHAAPHMQAAYEQLKLALAPLMTPQ